MMTIHVWLQKYSSNAVVTCEKLFQIYFSLRRRTYEIILFQRVETCLKLFSKLFQRFAAHEYFPAYVQCR